MHNNLLLSVHYVTEYTMYSVVKNGQSNISNNASVLEANLETNIFWQVQ
jgi:hypothetical protein